VGNHFPRTFLSNCMTYYALHYCDDVCQSVNEAGRSVGGTCGLSSSKIITTDTQSDSIMFVYGLVWSTAFPYRVNGNMQETSTFYYDLCIGSCKK
jgi:hypothetical protein